MRRLQLRQRRRPGTFIQTNADAINSDAVDPSDITEFTKASRFVREYKVDASEGGACGLDTAAGSAGAFNYAPVDDVTNSISIYRLLAD